VNYSTELSPGTIIDRRYRIEKTLGQGGFGRTYLVRDDNRFGDYFVLKEFVPRNADEYVVNKSRELFEREAQVLNKLEHPQIPKFFGWFKENERLFFVQAFIDGQTYSQLLRQRFASGKTFSEQEVLDLLYSLLPVLDYIHNNNIVHRDISPDNIMLCRHNQKPMLIDFGVVNQRPGDLSDFDDHLDRNATTVGKVGYSPPEQIMRGICFPNSDLYALAVTALVLLTGKSPADLFNSSTDSWRWREFLNLKSNLGNAFDKMLKTKPSDRLESAKKVLDCLSATVVNPTASPRLIKTTIKPEPSVTEVLQPISAPDTIINSNNSTIERPRVIPSNPPKSPPFKLIALGSLALILLGGTGLVWSQSPKISNLCHSLNNCSPDIEFQEQYDRAIDSASPTLTKIENPQQIAKLESEDLESVRDTLIKTIDDLKTIPRDVKVYSQAQQSLRNFQDRLEQVEAEIEQRKNKPIW
jgi:serine/threonine protein kinase